MSSLFLSCPQVDKSNEKRDFPKDELWDLCQAAYAQYQLEIVNGRKRYHRYVSDFLSFHLPIDSCDINHRRIHSKNLSTMFELLSERQDLVKAYFTSPRFNYDKYLKMVDELNCEGELRSVNFQYNDVTNFIGCSSPRKCLAYLSSEQILYLTEFINSVPLFSKKLTTLDIEDFFACTLEEPLQAVNNSRVAMFLFCLRDQHILVHNWQKVIQEYKLISSSSTGLPLKCYNIGNALTDYRKVHGSPDPLYVHVAKHLKEMTE